jgi:hypothetical protein
LKGWYRTALETMSRPCPQTVVRQREEWIELYWRQDSPGDSLPINLQSTMIPNTVPFDHMIRDMAQDLRNGRAGGASKMRIKDIKVWLCSITLEEDPE